MTGIVYNSELGSIAEDVNLTREQDKHHDDTGPSEQQQATSRSAPDATPPLPCRIERGLQAGGDRERPEEQQETKGGDDVPNL